MLDIMLKLPQRKSYLYKQDWQHTQKWAMRLTSMMVDICWSVTSRRPPACTTPALFTRTSTGSRLLASAATAARSVTSRRKLRACSAACCDTCATRRRVSSHSVSITSTHVTRLPSRAKFNASSRPSAPPAPVICNQHTRIRHVY